MIPSLEQRYTPIIVGLFLYMNNSLLLWDKFTEISIYKYLYDDTFLRILRGEKMEFVVVVNIGILFYPPGLHVLISYESNDIIFLFPVQEGFSIQKHIFNICLHRL